MTSPESVEFSSIRAVRPVVPSDSLRHFIREAEKLVIDFDLQNGFDVEPKVFAADSLHVTLFKRRAETSEDVEVALSKIEHRIADRYHYGTRPIQGRRGVSSHRSRRTENPLRAMLESAEGLNQADSLNQGLASSMVFRSSRIVSSAVDSTGHPGYELSLVVDDGPVASMLELQSDLMTDVADKMVANRALPAQVPESPLEIPFMRAPFDGEAERDEFIEFLGTELPVHDLSLRRISYRRDFNG